jgi:hypothetical protein
MYEYLKRVYYILINNICLHSDIKYKRLFHGMCALRMLQFKDMVRSDFLILVVLLFECLFNSE